MLRVITNTDTGNNPVGLLVNKSVTIAGIDATGALITDAGDVAATVTAAVESNWGTSFFVTAPNVTITGLTLIGAAPGDMANKVIEVVQDNFVLTHSGVGSVTGDIGTTVYVNDQVASADPGFVSDIQSFTIANNILRGDFVLTHGAGFGHATTSLLLTDSAFVRNPGSSVDGNWGVIINGRDDAVAWKVQSVGPLVATGNSFATDYTTDRVLFVRDDDASRLPTAAFVEAFIADNGIASYAYAVDADGVPSFCVDDGGYPNATGTTNGFALTLTAGNGSSWAKPGDTLIVQTDGMPATETIVTDNLSIDLQSAGLTLELGTGVADVTLLAAQDANVTGNAEDNTITGNDGANSLQGADGADTMTGGAGADSLDGGAGADDMTGGADADAITGGAGDDIMQVDTADTLIDGGSDTDTAVFAAGTDLAAVQAMEAVFTGTEIIRIGEAGSGATFVVFDGMSIQTAIDAAGAGDTIIIGAGTFAGNLTVDKALTILGANQGIAGDDARGDETTLTGSVTIAADGITVDGLHFDGGASAIRGQAGALAYDSLTIRNNLIENTTDSAIRLGLGSGGGLGSETWTITDNKISAIAGNALTGMVLVNVTGLTVTGNVITHDDTAFTGRRGINLDAVQDAIITGNAVDMGLVAPTDATVASTASPWAIQLSMSDRELDTVDVSGNTIIGASTGIVGLSQRGLVDVSVSGNTISDVVNGVVLNGGSTPPQAAGTTMALAVTGNTITAAVNAVLVRDLHGGQPSRRSDPRGRCH